MDTVPDRNVRNAPYFPQPHVIRRPPADATCQPARSPSPRLPAAQLTPPSAQFTLDSKSTNPSHSPDIKSSEQLLQQILNTLQNSNIVEKEANDERSRFWTVYQKVAAQHDNEFLEHYDGDMDIVLIFSGLFSAVNTAFITTMGPSDATTTDALLTQIITLMVMNSQGAPITDNYPLPVPPAYSSGQICLLAAFGAVLGKQWLRFYKLKRFGGGSLEERGKSRQRKLDGLETWHFDAVLQTFPVLLEISLLLFGISLSSYVWTQQRTITSIIIATTVFGFLFHSCTLFASLLSPLCPFQTPATLILRMAGAFMWAGSIFIKNNDRDFHTLGTSFRSFLRGITVSISRLIQRLLNPKTSSDTGTESAVQWVLATSTDPDNIATAASLIPTITWSPNSDILSYCQRLQDTFVRCFDADGNLRPSAEDRAIACGRALNYLCLTVPPIGDDSNTRTASPQLRIWHQWRSIILPQSFDRCKTLACQLSTSSAQDRQRCQADVRTALRMMIATAGDGFIHPDHDSIIWRGCFTWSGDRRTAADFDWLVDYLVSRPQDHTAIGDALLALSAMKGLGTHDRASAYLQALISSMKSYNPHRLRYAALRAVSESRMKLANIDAIEDKKIRDLLLTELSPALLTAISPDTTRAAGRRGGDEPEVNFNYWRDDTYLRLIMVLASNIEWCKCLVADQHIGYCISILNHLDEHSPAPFHLAAIFGRIYASSSDTAPAAFEAVADEDFLSLAKSAWQTALDLKLYDEAECISAFPAVVRCTGQKDIPATDLKDIHRNVGLVMDKLKRRNKCPEITSIIRKYYTTLTNLIKT
ncbi:uncharacterized protein EDB91DRAFT_1255516 [Suillus paluster]|uniref:uncharacterized protein n=1 Tax=Suillus paluster TaxID=48578 RepID=UPI001B8690B3|nr:uncharacterized protein EDB91DRAFT_1255516 [Suillus paluster]KAG1723780.1 hypothetical protein EDB91DRAFT_1255516 [Suillus paluster]